MLLLVIKLLPVNATNSLKVLVSRAQSRHLSHLQSFFFFLILLALATSSLSNAHVTLTISTKWMWSA